MGRDLMARAIASSGSTVHADAGARRAAAGDPPHRRCWPTPPVFRSVAPPQISRWPSCRSRTSPTSAVPWPGRPHSRARRSLLPCHRPSVNSAGEFPDQEPDSVSHEGVVLPRAALHRRHRREGLGMTFASEHRTIETFSRALEGAGFVVEAMREVSPVDGADQWSRSRCFSTCGPDSIREDHRVDARHVGPAPGRSPPTGSPSSPGRSATARNAVFAPHATAGIALMETGSGSEADLDELLDRLLPRDDRYRHRHGSLGHGADHLLPVLVEPGPSCFPSSTDRYSSGRGSESCSSTSTPTTRAGGCG